MCAQRRLTRYILQQPFLSHHTLLCPSSLHSSAPELSVSFAAFVSDSMAILLGSLTLLALLHITSILLFFPPALLSSCILPLVRPPTHSPRPTPSHTHTHALTHFQALPSVVLVLFSLFSLWFSFMVSGLSFSLFSSFPAFLSFSVSSFQHFHALLSFFLLFISVFSLVSCHGF